MQVIGIFLKRAPFENVPDGHLFVFDNGARGQLLCMKGHAPGRSLVLVLGGKNGDDLAPGWFEAETVEGEHVLFLPGDVSIEPLGEGDLFSLAAPTNQREPGYIRVAADGTPWIYLTGDKGRARSFWNLNDGQAGDPGAGDTFSSWRLTVPHHLGATRDPIEIYRHN